MIQNKTINSPLGRSEEVGLKTIVLDHLRIETHPCPLQGGE